MAFRIAVIQMDFNPAYYSEGTYHIVADPADMSQLEAARSLDEVCECASLADRQDLVGDVRGWKETSRKSYLEYLKAKLKKILDTCKEKSVNMAVFPEYSIPAELLIFLNRYTSQMIIFAGTHTISSHFQPIYNEVGLEVKAEDEQRSMCVVLMGERAVRIDKMKRSWQEPHLKEGRCWEHIILTEKKHGVDATLVCLICSDFLSPPKQAEQYVTGNYGEANNIVFVIPANTPIEQPVHDMGLQVLEFMERNVKRFERHAVYLLANSAHYGGSRVYFHNRDMLVRQLADSMGFLPMPAGEEGLLVCDLLHSKWEAPDRQHFFTGLGAQRFPFVNFEPMPLVYHQGSGLPLDHGRRQQHEGLGVHEFLEALRSAGGQAPVILCQKLAELANLDLEPRAEVERLTSLVDMEDLPTLAEWRFQYALATHGFLSELAGKEFLRNAEAVRTAVLEAADTHYRLAMEHAAGLRIGYLTDLLKEEFTPAELLEGSSTLAMRVLRQPSSEKTEVALACFVQEQAGKEMAADEETWRGKVANVCRIVCRVRPLPCKRLADGVLSAVEDQKAKEEIGRLAREHVEARDGQIEQIAAIMGENVLKQDDRLLLYGYSTAVVRALRQLPSEVKRSMKLFVAECQNRLGEDTGPLQARELRQSGFPEVYFVHHASIFRCLQKQGLTKVLMGFNFVTREDVVNTIGSFALVRLAQSASVPVYACGPSLHIWPDDLAYSPEVKKCLDRQHRPKWRPQEALMSMFPPPGRDDEIFNFAYDQIPLAELYAVVTDEGVRITESEVAS